MSPESTARANNNSSRVSCKISFSDLSRNFSRDSWRNSDRECYLNIPLYISPEIPSAFPLRMLLRIFHRIQEFLPKYFIGITTTILLKISQRFWIPSEFFWGKSFRYSTFSKHFPWYFFKIFFRNFYRDSFRHFIWIATKIPSTISTKKSEYFFKNPSGIFSNSSVHSF